MINHLYPNFLKDLNQYALSETYWQDLWQTLNDPDRTRFGWQKPWFQPLPPKLGQGNPIFTAFSPLLRRGIRVIQHEPTSQSLEIQAWPDSFGGAVTDPESIKELVIACALSDVAARVAKDLMQPWVANRPISFHTPLIGALSFPARPGDLKPRHKVTIMQGYDAA